MDNCEASSEMLMHKTGPSQFLRVLESITIGICRHSCPTEYGLHAKFTSVCEHPAQCILLWQACLQSVPVMLPNLKFVVMDSVYVTSRTFS